MPTSRNVNTYSDVREVLDTALEHGELIYRLATPGKARNWRQRAYTFRNLLQQLAEERLPLPGHRPGTPYDELVLELEESCVRISLRVPKGIMTLPDGTPVRAKPAPAPEADDLISHFRNMIEDE